MNKLMLSGVCCVIGILAAAELSGCARLGPEDRFYEYKVPAEKLRDIEPMEPNQFTVQVAEQKANGAAEVVPPPAEMSISLEQCRAVALENNLDIQAQLIAPSIAAASVGAEEARFEAAFYANASLLRTDRPSGAVVPLGSGSFLTDITSSQYQNTDADLGVRVPLRTGGSLDFSLADSRSHNLAENVLLNPWYENSFSFSVSQPLLKNAGHRVNMHSIRLARYGQQITDNATKLEVIRVLASADRGYWRLYAARNELQVRRKQHELAAAQLERAKRLVEAGQQPGVEILRAEAGAASQLAAIITAENNLRNCEREFKRIINRPGLDIETPTIMIPATEADPVHYVFGTQKLIDHAFENRSELLEMELRIAEDISRIDYLNNQMLPLVTLDYSYNVNGTGPTRSDAYDMLGRKNYETHRAGVSLWVPLGNEAAKNQLRGALYQKRQRLSTKESQRQLVKQEVLNALDQVETNWQQILAGRQNSLLQGRLYEAEIRQFELGLRTSTDVLESQANLADAQSAEIRALADYHISLVDMAYATGTLLGADKIQWQAIVPSVPVK